MAVCFWTTSEAATCTQSRLPAETLAAFVRHRAAMKFGKLLKVTAAELPEMEEVFACYKAAKKVLKLWGGDAQSLCVTPEQDEQFLTTLSLHLTKFNKQWEEREKCCMTRFAGFQQKVLLTEYMLRGYVVAALSVLQTGKGFDLEGCVALCRLLRRCRKMPRFHCTRRCSTFMAKHCS